MKILLYFTYPQVVLNLHEFHSSSEHKGKHFNECGEPISKLTSIVFFPDNGSQWLPATVWLSLFFKISLFVFCKIKKELEGE